MSILVNKEKLKILLKKYLYHYRYSSPCDCGICPLYESNSDEIDENGCDKDCVDYLIKYLQGQ